MRKLFLPIKYRARYELNQKKYQIEKDFWTKTQLFCKHIAHAKFRKLQLEHCRKSFIDKIGYQTG